MVAYFKAQIWKSWSTTGVSSCWGCWRPRPERGSSKVRLVFCVWIGSKILGPHSGLNIKKHYKTRDNWGSSLWKCGFGDIFKVYLRSLAEVNSKTREKLKDSIQIDLCDNIYIWFFIGWLVTNAQTISVRGYAFRHPGVTLVTWRMELSKVTVKWQTFDLNNSLRILYGFESKYPCLVHEDSKGIRIVAPTPIVFDKITFLARTQRFQLH